MTDFVPVFQEAERIPEHVRELLNRAIYLRLDLFPDRAPGLNCVILAALRTEPDHLLDNHSVTSVVVNQMKRAGTEELFTAFTLRDRTFEHVTPFRLVKP